MLVPVAGEHHMVVVAVVGVGVHQVCTLTENIHFALAELAEGVVDRPEVVERLRGWCRMSLIILAGCRRSIAGGGSRGLKMVEQRSRQRVFVLGLVAMSLPDWRM